MVIISWNFWSTVRFNKVQYRTKQFAWLWHRSGSPSFHYKSVPNNVIWFNILQMRTNKMQSDKMGYTMFSCLFLGLIWKVLIDNKAFFVQYWVPIIDCFDILWVSVKLTLNFITLNFITLNFITLNFVKITLKFVFQATFNFQVIFTLTAKKCRQAQ